MADKPEVGAFLDYCLARKQPDQLADRCHFSFYSLRPWLGYIMILDYLPDCADFRYRLYGSGIVEYTGFDMTGRRVSEFYSNVARFYGDQYRQALHERIIIFSHHVRVHAHYAIDWVRVACPVTLGEKQQIVACSYPIRQEFS